jgi:hypothetical protein
MYRNSHDFFGALLANQPRIKGHQNGLPGRAAPPNSRFSTKTGGVISYHLPAKEAGFRKALYRNDLSQTLPFQWCVVSSPGACRNPFTSPI